MKNFEQILSDAGVELTDEQKAAISKDVAENYKTINDWQKQHDKVQNLTEQLDSTKEALKKFDGVDAEALNKQIADLKADLEKKDTDYQAQIADRDFQDMLKESIANAKGKNAKAISALLDLETLKATKNQKEDIAAALKTLAEAEDSKMLFGEAEPEEDILGKGDPIGAVTKKGGSSDAWLNQMMEAAGISTESNE